jgi:5-methylcytosine-specific restriction endonuclease McrA
MSKSTVRVAKCGHSYNSPTSTGRTRENCPDCTPEPWVREPMGCQVCGGIFSASSSRSKYCSRECKEKGKPSANNGVCSVCGEPMQIAKKSASAGKTKHNRCVPEHGPSGYNRGCRCSECKAGAAERMRNYAASYRAKNGIHPTVAFRRAFREANGYWPNARGSDWIHPRIRREIYERDGWTCYLCDKPLDLSAGPNGNRAPSLDHVIPRSKGGTHDPSNLKTACRSCNSRKGVSYEPHGGSAEGPVSGSYRAA